MQSVHEANIFETLCFMFICKISKTPSVFSDIYRRKPINKYLLRSIGILSEPYFREKCSEFIISFCGPHIWNKILARNSSVANIQLPSLFKTIIKTAISNTVNLITESYWNILKWNILKCLSCQVTIIKTVMSSIWVLNDKILWLSLRLFSLRFIFHVDVLSCFWIMLSIYNVDSIKRTRTN